MVAEMKKAKIDPKTTQANPRQPANQWGGWFVIVAAGIGLGICLYLFSFHTALLRGEIKDGVLCSTASGLGCHSVAASPYSVVLGLPLASWGAIFYSALLILGIGGVIFRRDCGHAYLRWAFWLAVAGFAIDLFLAHTMIFRLRAVCWLCLATYIINLAVITSLAASVWREPKPKISLIAIFPGTNDARGADRYYRNVIKSLLVGCAVIAAVAGIAGTQFVAQSLTGSDRERLARIKDNLSRQKPKLIEVEKRPFMGSAAAKLTVVEFSDFLCPYCAKASTYLKLSETGKHDKARLVFRHYPLDKSCNRIVSSDIHPGACLLAEGAVCAAEQDRFWEYHDMAFETTGSITQPAVHNIAANIGLDLNAFKSCLESGRGLEVVKEDIEAGIRAGVSATPTLFINGRILRGVPKPWVLNEILLFGEQNLPAPE